MMVSKEPYKFYYVDTGGEGLGGGSAGVEFLEDKVRVKFHLQRAVGSPDQDKFYEIPYKTLDQLPRIPPLKHAGVGGDWTLEKRYVHIELPSVGKNLVFVYENYMETYSGAWSEEEVWGPFIKKN